MAIKDRRALESGLYPEPNSKTKVTFEALGKISCFSRRSIRVTRLGHFISDYDMEIGPGLRYFSGWRSP